MDIRELFLCCRIGNFSRVRYLVEERDVDLNVRDKWDGTPLYYACLCGHYEIVHYLLQHGVQCDANTYDGERCLYSALTDDIRRLLKDFKVITPVTMRRDKYSEFLRSAFEDYDYCDICFTIGEAKAFAHKSILAARSKHFQQLLYNSWKDKSSIDLTHLNITPEVFKCILQYLYMGELNVNKNDIEAFVFLAKYFCMDSLVHGVTQILPIKKKMPVLHVQSSPSPQEDFLKMYLTSLPKDLRIEGEFQDAEFVDLHIKVKNHVFFCHKVLVCGRCDYFKALVTDHFSETFSNNEAQVITLHEADPYILMKILKYIYTDTIDLLPGNALDILCLADMFILPGLKMLCSSVVQENLTTDNVIPAIKVARLYDLPRLETQCTEYMAIYLEEIIDNPDFKNLILDDASEIKNREETDTISVIDDIRYYIGYSAQVSMPLEKNMLIDKLLESLKLEA